MKKSFLVKVLTDALFYGSLSSRVDNNGVFITELAEKDAMKIISELEKFEVLKNIEEDSVGFKEWLKNVDPKSFVSNSFEEDDLKLAWDACLSFIENEIGVDYESHQSIFEYVKHLRELIYELEQNYLEEKNKTKKLLQQLETFNKRDEQKYFETIYNLEVENKNLREVLTYTKRTLDSGLVISPNKDTHTKISDILGK
jgi:hypothetical protein